MEKINIAELRSKSEKDLKAFFTQHKGKVEVVIGPTERVPGHIEALAHRIVTTGGHVIKDRNGETSR